MLIDWKTLRIPEPVVAEPMLEEWPQPELIGDLALQIADSLRKAASVIDRTSEMGEEEYQGIESQVRNMQTVYDQSQFFVAKMVRDLTNRATTVNFEQASARRLKYNTTYLLRVFLLSDCLRNSGQLSAAIEYALALALPPVLLFIVQGFFRGARTISPDPATISKWRLIVDGSLMLWHRRQNARRGFVRFLMSDSSSQHGRQFQVTCVQSIKSDQLLPVFLEINGLINVLAFR